MIEFWRLLQIIRVIIRYRLDTLINTEALPFSLRCLLNFTKIKSVPSISRGARLRKACEDLGPIFIKFGQLLSTRPDLVPADIIEELDHLQDNVPPFDNDTFKSLVEKALDAPVEECFAEFSAEPLASASVAQVHAATLKTGEDVVIKIVRPGIEKIIEKDVALLQLIARLLTRFSSEARRLRPMGRDGAPPRAPLHPVRRFFLFNSVFRGQAETDLPRPRQRPRWLVAAPARGVGLGGRRRVPGRRRRRHADGVPREAARRGAAAAGGGASGVDVERGQEDERPVARHCVRQGGQADRKSVV